jgi:hypothetical protein
METGTAADIICLCSTSVLLGSAKVDSIENYFPTSKLEHRR